jgi:hypothetical protein
MLYEKAFIHGTLTRNYCPPGSAGARLHRLEDLPLNVSREILHRTGPVRHEGRLGQEDPRRALGLGGKLAEKYLSFIKGFNGP